MANKKPYLIKPSQRGHKKPLYDTAMRPYTVRMPDRLIAHCKASGGSAYLRKLVEKDIKHLRK